MDKDQIDRILATLTAREERLQEMSEALASKDSMIEKQQESMNRLLEKVESLTTVQQQLPTMPLKATGYYRSDPLKI